MITTADRLLFGTAGVPHSSPGPSSLAGIKHVAHLGLDCMEVEFVKGVKMGSDTAQKIKESSRKLDVRLSVHAPYYVNLNSPDKGKWLVSQERILNSARLAALCGAQNVVFHCGYYGNDSPEKAYQNIKTGLEEITAILKSERTPVTLRPETMGKRSQFGSLEEILFLCRDVEGLLPCIDISHIHAREGKVNSYNEFYRILTKMAKKLGPKSLTNLHIHISGVEYSAKGEIKHLLLKESDFKYDEWIQVLKDFDVRGMLICESPIQEQDAVLLKDLFYC